MIDPSTLIHSRYRVVHLIGQGGMGAVYEAIDERLGHRVALKQTLVSGKANLDRAFEREAKVLARLRHPALPVVSDFFAEAAGHFLVMQFIPGDDLATQLAARSTPFPPEMVLRWADELLHVCRYLHSRQPPILHRDIKPQNLKVGEDGEIILLDFGLAKGSALLRSQASGGSSVFGYTPQYAPLEQIQGEGTDQRSDLYALAATLYHLATGQPPVDALTRISHMARRQPDPLQTPHALNPLLPLSFASLLMSALSLDPAERPSSAQAMREALGQPEMESAGFLPLESEMEQARAPAGEEAQTSESPGLEVTAPLDQKGRFLRQPRPTGEKGYRTGNRSRPVWYIWVASVIGIALVSLLGGGAWWLAGEGVSGSVVLPPTPTVTATAPATVAEAPLNSSTSTVTQIAVFPSATQGTPTMPPAPSVTIPPPTAPPTSTPLPATNTPIPPTATIPPPTALPASPTATAQPALLYEGQFAPGSIKAIQPSADEEGILSISIPHKFRAIGFSPQLGGGGIEHQRVRLPTSACGWGNGLGLSSSEAGLPDRQVIIVYMCPDAPTGTYTFAYELNAEQVLRISFVHTNASP